MVAKNPGPAGGSAPSLEETADRIRAINEKIIEATKSSGDAWLEAYEKSLKSMLDFENQAAEATQNEWVTSLAKAHTELIANITSTYSNAVRDALK